MGRPRGDGDRKILYLLVLGDISSTFQAIWDHIWDSELDAVSSDLPVVATLPPLAPSQDWTKMTEIFMEKMNVPALYIANKSVLALFGGGQMTGRNYSLL